MKIQAPLLFLALMMLAACAGRQSSITPPPYLNVLIIDRTFLSQIDEHSTYDHVGRHYNDLRALLVMGDRDATRLVVRIAALAKTDGAYAETMDDLVPLAYENEDDFWTAVEELPRPAQQLMLAQLDELQTRGARLLDWPNPWEFERHPAIASLAREPR